MLREGLTLIHAEDDAEISALTRRIEFLRLKSSYLWKYRKDEIAAAYKDVSDGIGFRSGSKAEEEK